MNLFKSLISLRFSLLALAAGYMGSCAPATPPAPPPRAQQVLYEWFDDGGDGEVTITIRLNKQRAEVRRAGRLIGWCYVATGREGYGTKPGVYPITEKIVDKYSNRYGWIEDAEGNMVIKNARYNDPVGPGLRYVPAPMPYWMRLTDYGIGLHGGIIPEPGQPASHGCIRMPKEVVPQIFDSVKVGSKVIIVP